MKHQLRLLRVLRSQASTFLEAAAAQQRAGAACAPQAAALAAVLQHAPANAAAPSWLAQQGSAAGGPGWHGFSTSAWSADRDEASRSKADGEAEEASTSGSSDGGNGSGHITSSALQASMDKLVDTAVQLVEQGRLGQAIDVLKQGIEVLQSAFSEAPELSELHNQVALLLFFADKPDEAATHAQAALDITKRHFGEKSVLTGHRVLRLGTIWFGQGRPRDAAPLLEAAADMLRPLHKDPALAEAHFYRALLSLAAASTPGDVQALKGELTDALSAMVDALGAESMIVRLALGQHSRLVNRSLDSDFALGEAAFKQHMALQEVQDPSGGPELGLTAYQLATLYYAHDLLNDAGSALQRGVGVLRQHYPEDHDLLLLCRHRMGMVCAAGRDHRAATKLLQESRQHYAQQEEGHPLQHEAEAGLAMAKIKSLQDSQRPADERKVEQKELLDEVQRHIAAMAGALGSGHMLVQGASRYLAQLATMAGRR